MPGFEEWTPLVALLCLAPGDRRRGCGPEDLAPALALRDGFLLSGVVDLLEDAWHRKDEGGGEGVEVGDQGLGVRGEAHPDPGMDADNLNEPREDVGQRQEQQCRSPQTTIFIDSVAFSARAMKLSWVSWQPLGRPVVPRCRRSWRRRRD